MNYYNKELAEKECSIRQKGGRKKNRLLTHLRRKIRKFLFVLAVVSSSRLYVEK